MKESILLIGGGGHCKSVIDVIEAENKYKIIGIIDKAEKLGKKTFGYETIGADDDIPQLAKVYNNFIITVGHIKTPDLRIKLYEKVKKSGGTLPTIISPIAHISKYSRIGEGTVIMHHAIVNSDALIGKNCIINNRALIEHDTCIGNFSHISTSVTVNGNCIIHDNCFIGSGSVIVNGLSISKNTIVGAGAVVHRDLTESGIYVGVPTKKIK